MLGLTITITLILGVVGLIYNYLTNLWKYWDRKGVPLIADNVLTGGMTDMFLRRSTPFEVIGKIYEKGDGLRYFGTFVLTRPVMIVRDPEIIRGVLLKDFANFPGNGFLANEESDPLSGTLFNLSGIKWKAMRSKLTHAFTTAKIKYMFGTMLECLDRVHRVFEQKIAASGKNVDVREIFGCLGTDIIASVAFGIEVNSVENPQNEFRQIGKRMTTPNFLFFARMMILGTNHKLAEFLNIKQLDSTCNDFIINLVKRTVEYREKNNVVRPDFLNLLLQLKNQGYIEGSDEPPDFKSEMNEPITLDELTAQVFLFFQAGFETITTTGTLTIYELCMNKEVKRKVQEECDKVLAANDGQITYETLQTMHYLESVLLETLRLYPSVGALLRQTARNCKLPETDVELEKGTAVAIPIFGLHKDPQYFPDPEKFDPQRFTEAAKANRPPYVYMPFSEGPGICIGMRFALVQLKMVLLSVLSRYDFEISEETPLPLRFDPLGMIPFPIKLFFTVTKRTEFF